MAVLVLDLLCVLTAGIGKGSSARAKYAHVTYPLDIKLKVVLVSENFGIAWVCGNVGWPRGMATWKDA